MKTNYLLTKKLKIMNACPNINPLHSPRPQINNIIGSVNLFGEIRDVRSRLIGKVNMHGDVDLIGTNRTFAKIDSFGILRTGIDQIPVGRISGSLPRILLKNDLNRPSWLSSIDEVQPKWKSKPKGIDEVLPIWENKPSWLRSIDEVQPKWKRIV